MENVRKKPASFPLHTTACRGLLFYGFRLIKDWSVRFSDLRSLRVMRRFPRLDKRAGKDKNCHPSSWLQDLRQLPHDTVKPLNKTQPLLRSSLTVKRMSLQDEGRTGKASAGTPYSILVVSLGRAVSCFVISRSHGLLNCEE